MVRSRQRAWANSVSTAYSEMQAEVCSRLASLPVKRTPQDSNDYPVPATEDVIEMFIFTLVAISRKRRTLVSW